jgi:hypothetical protein
MYVIFLDVTVKGTYKLYFAVIESTRFLVQASCLTKLMIIKATM